MKSLAVSRPNEATNVAHDTSLADGRKGHERDQHPTSPELREPKGAAQRRHTLHLAFFWDACLRHGHAALGYLLIWGLAIVRMAYDARMGTMNAESLMNAHNATGLMLAFIFSWLAISANFRFVLHADEAAFYGSLPLKRRDLYATVLAAAVVPLLAAVGVLSLVLVGVWSSLGLALTSIAPWAGLQVLMLVTFCGIAALCVELAGRYVVAGIMYAVANVYSALLGWEMWMLNYLALPTLPRAPWTELGWAAPGYYMARYLMFNASSDAVPEGTWPYLVGTAVAGIACMVLAGLLFERRDLERAGDAFTFGLAQALATVLLSLVAGLGLTLLLCSLIFGTTLSVLYLAGGVPGVLLALLSIGCCGAMAVLLQMCFGRSARAVRRHLPNIVVTLLTATVVALLCTADITGAERYVPNPSEVQSVSMGSLLEVPLENEDAIQSATKLQQALVDSSAKRNASLTKGNQEDFDPVWFSYRMKNGDTVGRQYILAKPGEGQDLSYDMGQLLQSDGVKQQVKDDLEDALSTNAQRAIVTIGGNNTTVSGKYWSSDSATYDTNETSTTNAEIKVFPANYANLLAALEADIDEHGAACASCYAMATRPGIYAQEWEASITIWSGFSSDANKSAAPITFYLSESDTPHAYQWTQERYGSRVFGES